MQPPGEQVLELYGNVRRKLHRPAIVEAGCMVFALTNLASLSYIGIPFYRKTLMGFMSMQAIIRVEMTGAVVLNACMMAGILLIVLGDLGRRVLNPWPRRLWLAADFAAVVIVSMELILWQHSLSVIDAAGLDGTGLVRFYMYMREMNELILHLSMYAVIFAVAGAALALAYTLQIAAWLQSRALAVAGIIIFGFGLAPMALHALVLVIEVRLLPFSGARLNGLMVAENWARMIAAAMFCVYCLVLAVRLRRYRRMPVG